MTFYFKVEQTAAHLLAVREARLCHHPNPYGTIAEPACGMHRRGCKRQGLWFIGESMYDILHFTSIADNFQRINTFGIIGFLKLNVASPDDTDVIGLRVRVERWMGLFCT